MAYKPGKWWAHCDVCGFKYYNDELRERWDGLMVCKHDYEPDHPQKFLRVPSDKISVPWVRRQVPVFVNQCSIVTSSAYADMGTADCARADNTTFTYEFLLGQQ